ncbi:diacylglycerol kinase (ATP) [Salegentibacter echinorum]|uniref:Diacylglycerol kinase (ATP) n=1 Tax=Salegentibacter echinorum TaxID=1073325 RepID=A0A1M5C8U7_SALEC|nr:diacylglycerol kinase family protein [Salegentibacter echinorum]SHF51214.1 diacylglycerol kinase (ATP) [Salegentibacter echinorum]
MRDSFLGKRIRGGGYAIKGAWLLLKHEPSIQVQFALAIIMCCLGFFFGITKTEWLFQILAIGLIMTAEGLNTAVEAMADFVHPDFHSKIGHIKDVAAGAVFIAAITAVIIGGIIYFPYIF